MTYSDLIVSYRNNPREIPTAPTARVVPRWFRVCVRSDALYVASGRDHPEACRVNPDRRLRAAEFEPMLALYQRRKQGQSVSQEALRLSVNSSYWFGIFQDMQARSE